MVLWGIALNCFDEDEEGVVREGLSDYTHLLMLMKIWPGDWNNQLERMNMECG